MKLLFALLFLVVFFGSRLLFRARDVAAAAYVAARDVSDTSPAGDLRRAVKKVQREALNVADHVGEVVPGAGKVVYEFSAWVQLRMSTGFPGAVQIEEMAPPGARGKAGAFLAGALEAFVEHHGLAFPNEADYERFMRITLRRVGVGYLGSEGVEAGMKALLNESGQAEGTLMHAWAAGGTAVRMELRGHEPLPFENSLRDVMQLPAPQPVNGTHR